MKRRYTILLVLMISLVAANILNLEQRSQATPRKESRSPLADKFQLTDFQIKGAIIPSGEDVAIHRDLFYPLIEDISDTFVDGNEHGNSTEEKRVPVEMAKNVPPDIQRTPQQLEEEAARIDISRFKYVGFILHDGHGQAFLIDTDQRYFVFAGDKIGGRLVVDKVTSDTVTLVDPVTNIAGQIRISAVTQVQNQAANQQVGDF